MSKSKLPHMPLWVYDIESDESCALMTAEQFGVYVRLLIRQWIEGSIPADPNMLAALIRVPSERLSECFSNVVAKFEQHPDKPDRLVNPRLADERDKAIAKVEKNRLAGRKGGSRKAYAKANAKADAKANDIANGSIRASDSESNTLSSDRGDARGDAGPWRHYANQIMQAYPKGRRGLLGSALNAIGCAIRDLMQSPPDGVEPNPDAVADWLLARTRRFAECVRGADNPQFIWTAARWFEEQGYLQDESEWRQVGRNGKPLAQTDAERQERAAKAEQQRVARQAQAEEERRQRASEDREREAFIASKSDDELFALKDEVLATLPPASQRMHADYDPRTNPLMTKLVYAHCKGGVNA